MNPLNPSVPLTKRPSRSNSTSSSVTLRKAGSLSSRAGPRTSILRGRSTSPDSISRVLHSLNNSRQDVRGRPESTERRKPNTNFNVNRWSHSTSSSISGLEPDFTRKRTSSSGAVRRSMGGLHTGMSVFIPQDTSTSQISPRKTHMKRSSGGNAPNEGSSRLNFQDSSHLNVVRDLSQPTTNTGNTEFFNSTWEHRAGVNKFGQPVQGVSLQYTTDSGPSNPESVERIDRNLSPTRLGHRDRASKRSKDNSNSNVSTTSDQSRGKSHRSPKQKDMLSKALAMANNAVLLDNAQNIPGAIQAYNDACELLEQVMVRSSDMEDRRKLSAIRTTYSNRIAELHDLDDSFADLLDKALPDDPPSDEYDQPEDYYHDDSSFHARTSAEVVPTIELPLRQESLLPQIFGGDTYIQDRPLQVSRDPVIINSQLSVPMDAQYMPPPLSPRHPPTVQVAEDNLTPTIAKGLEAHTEDEAGRGASTTSWLENFDTPSSKSSSRLSSIDFGQEDGQLVSDIQAEFDAAMNAAVDSAYDDEMSQEPTPKNPIKSMDVLQHEALVTHDSTSDALNLPEEQSEQVDSVSPEDEAAEEERLLEEMTKEYGLESSYDNQSRQALPRESDSSGFSSRTWGSSVASIAATSGTALSTLAEAVEPIASNTQTNTKPTPHSTVTLSRRPSQTSAPTVEKHVPIRERRMSAASVKQLKIETFARHNSVTRQAQPQSQSLPTPSIEVLTEASPSEPPKDFPSFTSSASGTQPLTPLTSIASGDSHHGESPATPALTQGGSIDDNTNIPPSPGRLGRMMPPPSLTRKNVSTSSLKKGSLSINTAAADFLESPLTPGSTALSSSDTRHQSNSSTPAVPTPNPNVLTAGATGGMYLFDDQTSRLNSLYVDDSRKDDVASLEPCPESFLLRPFWLMRCLCSALTQPEGGYVTQKLFLSRDIWRVRNVKFKALDEKISTCDLLTAALQKLAKVDTLDAAAVLDEVQTLELVLEQVRGTLSKKLGSDVGLAGSTSVFKNSPAGDDNDMSGSRSANASSAAKSIASGWRKLRSKSSSANLASGNIIRDTGAQKFTMTSLPMTTSSSVATSRSYLNRNRDPPPTPSQLPNMPSSHAAYMSSLARLFSAAQVLDSIARQVEDPGLKYSSKIHVGLELSMRSAAEFFAFYIIRFVMSDLLMLVDKFLKRGTEWVMT